jgi:DNA polymerase I
VILLVDGKGLAYRMRHAGYGLRFDQGLDNLRRRFSPTHWAVAWEDGPCTPRRNIYPEYKANRTAPSELFTAQLKEIPEWCVENGVPCLRKAGWEVDDVIASLAFLAVEQDQDVVIASEDKDTLQLLVSSNVRQWRGGSLIDRYAFYREWQFPAGYLPDYLALAGDAVDNIPGVPSVGSGTAARLLDTYGSIDSLYRHLRDGYVPARTTKLLLEHEATVRMGLKLATLNPMLEFKETWGPA